MLLLQVLYAKGDCYGYELSQIIKSISNGELNFPVGSLYPALYKLIDKSYITDYKKQVGRRLIRVYYHIEDAGIDRLTLLKNEYYSTNECILRILNHDFDKEAVDE